MSQPYDEVFPAKTPSTLRASTRPRLLSTCAALIAAGLLASPLASLHAQELETLEGITAFGQGETRAGNRLSAEDFQLSIAGTSPDKSIGILPGVNVVTRDPFGFYEFGTDVRLRAFSLEQIAVNVDGVPMGSNSPRYGTRVGRVVDADNIEAIDVRQGSSDVDIPAYEALGGAILYTIRQPSKEVDAKLELVYGDFNTSRTFARFDTGEILPGLTAFASFSQFTFNTRGMMDLDQSERFHVDAVIRYEIEDFGNIELQYGYNDRDDFDTVGIRWDRWQALSGPRLSAADAADTFRDGAAQVYAQYGFIEYTPSDPRFGIGSDNQLSIFRYGDFTDRARELGPPDYIIHEDVDGDPVGAGESINAIFYDKWRNGRIDNFYRLVYDFSFMEDDRLKIDGNAYYQDKFNYGLWGVTKAASETEVRLGYAYDPFRTDITGAQVQRAGITASSTDAEVQNALIVLAATETDPEETYGPAGAGADRTARPRPVRGDFESEAAHQRALGIWISDNAAIASRMTVGGERNGYTYNGVEGRTGRDEDFGGHRYGFYNKGSFKLTETTTLIAGFWYEYDRHMANRPNYDFTNGGAVNGWFDYDQVLFNNYFRAFETDTYMLFVKGEQSLLDGQLNIAAGIRSLTVDRSVEGLINNQGWRENRRELREVTYEDNFLPQIGLRFFVTPEIEVFTNYSVNISAPDHASLATDSFTEALEEESATTIDLGARANFQELGLEGSIAFYYTEYEDRILAVAATDGASFLAGDTVFRNVGGVESMGMEASVVWNAPVDGLKITASLALQDTTFNEDVQVDVSSDPNPVDDLPLVPLGLDTAPVETRVRRDGFYTVPNTTRITTVTGDFNGDGVVTSDEVDAPVTGNEFLVFADISGNTLGNTPEVTFDLEVLYSIQDFLGAGDWSILLRGSYYDEVYLNTINTESVDSWFKMFGTLEWKADQSWNVAGLYARLSIDNILDDDIEYARNYEGQHNGQLLVDRGRFFSFRVGYDF